MLSYRKGLLDIPVHCRENTHLTYTVEKSIDSIWSFHSHVNAKKFNKKQNYTEAGKYCGNRKLRRFEDFYQEYYEDELYDFYNEEDSNELEKVTNIHGKYSKEGFTFDEGYNNGSKIIANDILETKIDSVVPVDYSENDNQNEMRCTKRKTVDKKACKLTYNRINENHRNDTLHAINSRDKKKIKNVNYEMQCFIETNNIKEDYLSNRFGKYFTEGNCIPRRFCISDKHVIQHGVFIIVCVLNEDVNQCEVCIKIFNVAEDIVTYLGIQREHGIFTFDLLLALCFNLHATHFTTHVLKIKKRLYSHRQKAYIEEHYKPTTEIIKMDDVWFDMIGGNDCPTNLNVSLIQTTPCSICFSSNNLTSLKSCGHYLCNACWSQYINAKVSSGYYNIICPEPKCKEQVESIIILTYLYEDLVQLFIRKRCEIVIQHTQVMQVCPSINCPNIALCRTTDAHKQSIGSIPSVMCYCNFTWCFKCQHQDHWPSSCEANKIYQRQKSNLLSQYDDNGNLLDNFVSMKRCPSCSYPIDKNGGCDHMMCKCGAQFCWRCLTKLRQEAQIHRCKDVNGIKIFLNTLDAIQKFSKRTILWLEKANTYNTQVQTLELALGMITKYKSVVGMKEHSSESSVSDNMNNDLLNSNVPTKYLQNCIRRRGISLLAECYKLLRNICVENAFRHSKHLSLRTRFHCEKLTPLLDDLFQSVNTNELEMKIGKVSKTMDAIKIYLSGMSCFAITNQ